jgi:glutathione S-transferase
MADLTIYLGNKNYASWSLRAWLALKRTGQPFEEVVIPIRESDSHEAILRHSPSGLVPALAHGELTVWDSLAIAEYLAEVFPDAALWPAARESRAVARAVSAEMHSGFTAVRQNMPMNVRSSFPGQGMAREVQENVNRITAIWRDCRRRFGGDGSFLFGAFTIADAMYAPVVSRFRTYGVELDEVSQEYANEVWELPEMKEWREAAEDEPWIIPAFEF